MHDPVLTPQSNPVQPARPPCCSWKNISRLLWLFAVGLVVAGFVWIVVHQFIQAVD